MSVCGSVSHHSLLEKQTRAVIKEILLLLAFLMVFCVVWLIEGVIYGILNVPHINVFALWLVCAIITSIGGIVVTIGFFVYLFCSKFSFSNSSHGIAIGEYSNMQTGRNGNRLIHDSSRESGASRSSDRDYNQFLSNSDDSTTKSQAKRQSHCLANSMCLTKAAELGRYLSKQTT